MTQAMDERLEAFESVLVVAVSSEPVIRTTLRTRCLRHRNSASPKAHFYQRLLAMDEGETKEIVDNFLKENSLGTLYDSVLIPALSLAEQDRHTDAVDEIRSNFIHQRTRELIEEVYEASQNASSSAQTEMSEAVSVTISGQRIVCIPARDDADDIVGTMVTQLLRRAGHDAHSLPIGAVSTMMEQLDSFQADVVCVSALPPFAAGQAKSLCKQLRQTISESENCLGLVGVSLAV